MKTAALSELTSTPNTFVCPEKSIGDMPLLPSGYVVDDNMTVNSHNEVDAKSRGFSHLLALSARLRHIIDPGQFLTGGPPAARRGDRGTVSLQYWSPSTALLPLQRTSPEAGFRGGVYGENIIAQQSSSDVSSNPIEWSHSWAMRKQKKLKNNNQQR